MTPSPASEAYDGDADEADSSSSIYCSNCWQLGVKHAGDKCLFGPTQYRGALCGGCHLPLCVAYTKLDALKRPIGHECSDALRGEYRGSAER